MRLRPAALYLKSDIVYYLKVQEIILYIQLYIQ